MPGVVLLLSLMLAAQCVCVCVCVCSAPRMAFEKLASPLHLDLQLLLPLPPSLVLFPRSLGGTQAGQGAGYESCFSQIMPVWNLAQACVLCCGPLAQRSCQRLGPLGDHRSRLQRLAIWPRVCLPPCSVLLHTTSGQTLPPKCIRVLQGCSSRHMTLPSMTSSSSPP